MANGSTCGCSSAQASSWRASSGTCAPRCGKLHIVGHRLATALFLAPNGRVQAESPRVSIHIFDTFHALLPRRSRGDLLDTGMLSRLIARTALAGLAISLSAQSALAQAPAQSWPPGPGAAPPPA